MADYDTRKARAVYESYSRGWITWKEAVERLAALGIPESERPGILTGVTPIPGY